MKDRMRVLIRLRYFARLALFLFAGVTVIHPDDRLVDEVIERVSKAVVRVVAIDTSNGIPRRAATGFRWVGRGDQSMCSVKACVVIALHVVIGADSILVTTQVDGLKKHVRGQIVAFAHDTDLALLSLNEDLDSSPLQYSLSSGEKTSLWVVGYPFGTTGLRSRVVRVSDIAPGTLRDALTGDASDALSRLGFPSLDLSVLQIEGDILPGDSGAPIIDEDGIVVGVGSGGLRGGTVGLGWAISADALDGLEENRGVPAVDTRLMSVLVDSFSVFSPTDTGVRADSMEEGTEVGTVALVTAPPSIWQLSFRTLGVAVFNGLDLAGFGDTIEVAIAFDRAIIVSGFPRVALSIGEQTRYANYFPGNGEDSRNGLMRFRYTVQGADGDADGVYIGANALTVNGASIKDASNRLTYADLSHFALHAPFLRVDGSKIRRPTVSSVELVELSSADGGRPGYKGGDTIVILVGFDREVSVSGTPQLDITVGSQTRIATYGRSSSDNMGLYFCYSVQATDVDVDGVSVGANAIALRGGAIKRAADGITDAELTHPALSADPNHSVDGGSPSSASDVIIHVCSP